MNTMLVLVKPLSLGDTTPIKSNYQHGFLSFIICRVTQSRRCIINCVYAINVSLRFALIDDEFVALEVNTKHRFVL